MPDTGAGYGGKHTGEVAIEAARLAKAAGKPVKLVWSRARGVYLGVLPPGGRDRDYQRRQSDGTITAWECHNYNSGYCRHPFALCYSAPAHTVSYRCNRRCGRGRIARWRRPPITSPAKSTWTNWRTACRWSRSHSVCKNLQDERLRAVLQAAASAFGWGKTTAAPGHGYGIAGGTEKGGYVANCAEVAVDRASGTVQLVRVVTAFECGAIVNPDGLKNQVEGAVIQGIGGALFEAIEFADGKILNPRFSRYRVPRFSDVPQLETVLLDRPDLPSAGAGECPIVALAPAVGNAIFDATGVRLRVLAPASAWHADLKRALAPPFIVPLLRQTLAPPSERPAAQAPSLQETGPV